MPAEILLGRPLNALERAFSLISRLQHSCPAAYYHELNIPPTLLPNTTPRYVKAILITHSVRLPATVDGSVPPLPPIDELPSGILALALPGGGGEVVVGCVVDLPPGCCTGV